MQLQDVSHIVVDEVHERTLQGDFLMALLRDIVTARRAAGNPLKVRCIDSTGGFCWRSCWTVAIACLGWTRVQAYLQT